jgi:threonine dehydratase
MDPAMLSAEEVVRASERIAPWVHRTPLMTSRSLNDRVGAKVFVKCEQFQRVGAFKFRGACNAIASLASEERRRGVVTHSSGNHAQALALAARLHAIPAFIVMPSNAPQVKRNAVIGYGAEVITCQPNLESRESTAEEVVQETGARFIHPYDDPTIIAGQGTAALEMLEAVPDLDLLIAPVGGGGLISGTCLAAKQPSRHVAVWGAEPAGADDAWKSKQQGNLILQTNPQTIADGLRTSLGELTWPFIRDQVEWISRISEAEIVASMRWAWERMKLLIEPSSATVLAALEQPDFAPYQGKKVGVILSGGNVDLDHLPWQEPTA